MISDSLILEAVARYGKADLEMEDCHRECETCSAGFEADSCPSMEEHTEAHEALRQLARQYAEERPNG